MTTTIEFPVNGRTGRAYIAKPQSGSGPGVVVLQEWWGLVDHIKSVCDRFAEVGYVAMAPDLFHGQSTKEPGEAERLFMQLNIDETEKDLGACINYLASEESCTSSKIAIIGFCMGGQLAMYAASKNPEKIAAVANFYGVHPNVKPDIDKIQAPVLGIFAEKDQFVPPEAAKKLEAELKSSGKRVEIEIFSDVDHAFFNDTRPDVYNEQAAQSAWQKTIRHFEANLA